MQTEKIILALMQLIFIVLKLLVEKYVFNWIMVFYINMFEKLNLMKLETNECTFIVD